MIDTSIVSSLNLSAVITLLIVPFAFTLVFKGIKVVPQSMVFVVERFGKYTKTLSAGLNFIVPFLDNVAHRISVLERQLPEFQISVITRDNVEVRLEATVFYRVVDAASSVYRIRDIDAAIYTAATSIVRSAAGKLELDELQSSRESMNLEIASNLQDAATIWGIEITRTEITDVIIDEETKAAQRQQLNAERERRAVIARAEGDKRSVELAAEAKLYQAQKEADAVRIKADAQAYAVEIEAKASAEQTRLVAAAIADNGQPAVNFEVLKRQVEAIAQLAGSANAKTVIVPTDVTAAIGSLQTLFDNLKGAPVMGEFDLAYWLFEPKVWIILGIVLIIADVFLGYTFFVLPIGVAALLIAGLIFAQGKLWFGDTVIFETWHDVGLWFAVLSVVSIGLLKMLARRWIKDQPDINEY